MGIPIGIKTKRIQPFWEVLKILKLLKFQVFLRKRYIELDFEFIGGSALKLMKIKGENCQFAV